MSLGDEFLGIHMGLLKGERLYWRVRLTGLPSYSEASKAAAGFQVVSCPSLCNDRCQGRVQAEVYGSF